MNPSPDPMQQAFRILTRHLVCLCGSYQYEGHSPAPPREPTFYHYTGFVITLWDEWFIATAGHCLRRLERAAADPAYKFSERWLVNFARPSTTPGIPAYFNPLEHPRYAIHRDEA